MTDTSTSSISGLSSEQSRELLLKVGPNEIIREATSSASTILIRQFKGAMILLLFGACTLSLILGEYADAIAIGVIVLLNGIIGFFQEYQAERSVQALRSIAAPRAKVLRDGMPRVISAAEVVPGDMLLLEAGDVVAADAHLLEVHLLRTNEAPLTGESSPVEKRLAPCPSDTTMAERFDCVFSGTSVNSGTGHAEVFATGMNTELGKIAHLLASTREGATPLELRLEQLGRLLLVLCVGVVLLVACLGFLRGHPWMDVLLSAVSLAVAAVPEGLTAVVTVALALGVQRMAQRQMLIRKLSSVETLGCATVICTDKTGTLTTGIMTVRELWGKDHTRLLQAAAACCDAELASSDPSGNTAGVGDSTELAILSAAAERDIFRSDIERNAPRLSELPFDSDRKRMSIYRADLRLYLKGAVEEVVPQCVVGTEGAFDANHQMAAMGLRVLAVAVGEGEEEEELELVGLLGIADPPRTEAIEAVKLARRAGIQTVMITGDHPATAHAIARELGILQPGEDPAGIVYARATAENKLEIIRGRKKRGDVVAMTGDGVNDAPALREAHIGIAMGRAGTEVTREASDMILTDDNFASIVAAIREGRGIYDNIRKSLVFQLTGNFGELSVMMVAGIIGLPLPLLPLQLLWINLVTDGLPALSLIAEPSDSDVLKRPPRPPEEPMLGRSQWTEIVLAGTLEALLSIAFFIFIHARFGLPSAREAAFSVIVFAQLFRTFASRSTTRILWQVGILSNVWLLGTVVVSIFLQFALRYIPFTRELMQLGDLPFEYFLVSMLIGLIPVSVLEIHKLLPRMNFSS